MTSQLNNLREWNQQGYNAGMDYMKNHEKMREDVSLMVEGAQSVICFLYNYYPENKIESDLKVSKYAYGKDYHKVIKKRLKQLRITIQNEFEIDNGRFFVDSAPIFERDYAVMAGLGWIGKNSLLINKKHGSFFFLAEWVVQTKLDYDQTFESDHCGTCTACIDNCPTNAILPNSKIDANRCISYLTIENKDKIPEEYNNKMQSWIFGCDICQDVCPWNRFSTPHNEEDFKAFPFLQKANTADWQNLTEKEFQENFQSSPIKRSGYDGIKRNVDFICKEIED